MSPPESREAQTIHDQLTKTHRLLFGLLKAGNNCREGVLQWSCLQVVHELQEYRFCVATHAKMSSSGPAAEITHTPVSYPDNKLCHQAGPRQHHLWCIGAQPTWDCPRGKKKHSTLGLVQSRAIKVRHTSQRVIPNVDTTMNCLHDLGQVPGHTPQDSVS